MLDFTALLRSWCFSACLLLFTADLCVAKKLPPSDLYEQGVPSI